MSKDEFATAAERNKDARQEITDMIHTAIERGNIDYVERLIQLGAIISPTDYHSRSYTRCPLATAVSTGNVDIVKLLLEKGATGWAEKKYSSLLRDEPEMIAIKSNNSEILSLLIENTMFNLKIYLESAVKSKSYECLEILLNYPKDIPAHTTHTALQQAARENDLKAAQMLIDHGASPERKLDNYEYNTIIHPVVENSRYEMFKILANAGAILQHRDGYNGKLPITISIEKNDIEMIKLFAEYKYDFSHPSYTILAAEHGSAELLQFMLDRGASVKSADFTRESPLMEAVFHGKIDNVAVLIKAGADVNATDQHHQSIAYWAVTKNDAAIFKMLIDAGMETAHIKGLVEIAKENNNKTIEQILIEEITKAESPIVKALDAAKIFEGQDPFEARMAALRAIAAPSP